HYGLVGFLFDLTFVLNSAGLLMEHLVAYFCFSLGIRDFYQCLQRTLCRLVTGMAQGTSSLLSNTVYAISDAASQFSKAARKALAKWVLFTSSGISSGLYHACDVGTCTFLYLATIDEVFKRAIHTVIAILTALLAATKAT
ncbi:hypothetical protein S245_036149, partial [Arachis hypogaea]